MHWEVHAINGTLKKIEGTNKKYYDAEGTHKNKKLCSRAILYTKMSNLESIYWYKGGAILHPRCRMLLYTHFLLLAKLIIKILN